MGCGGYRETQQYSRGCNCERVCTRTSVKQHLIPPEIKSALPIAVKAYALNLKVARGQAQVAPLVSLISVEQAAGNPCALGIEAAFPGAIDASVRLSHRCERHDHSLPGHEVVLRSRLNDQTAMRGGALLALGKLRIDKRHREAIAADNLGDRHIQHGAVLEHPWTKTRHLPQALSRQDGRTQLFEHIVG